MTKLERRRARHHVLALAAEHGVTLAWVRSWQASEAEPSLRACRVPVIQSGRDYLVALHELGHVLHPEARRLHRKYGVEVTESLACEAWAWIWAVDAALPELTWSLTKQDWRLLSTGTLGSYVQWHALRPRPSGTMETSAGTAPPAPLGD